MVEKRLRLLTGAFCVYDADHEKESGRTQDRDRARGRGKSRRLGRVHARWNTGAEGGV